MPAEETLLVISEIGIGDGLTLIPALQQLKKVRPALHIDMIAPGLTSIAENFHDTVTIVDVRDVQFHSDEARTEWLSARSYTYIWNTENERSPWRPILQNSGNDRWISSPPHSTWKSQYILDIRIEQIRRLFPDALSYTPLSLSLSSRQEIVMQDFISKYPEGTILIGIQPMAKDRTKIWSIEKYIRTAERLSDLPSVQVLFFVDPKEIERLAQQLPAHRDTIQIVADPLPDAIVKLAACRLFIGNDSGFYHLAYALGLNVIGLYRSRRNMKIWSHPSDRSRPIWFFLPAFIRRHWRKFIGVKRVYNTAVELIRPETDLRPNQIYLDISQIKNPESGRSDA